MEPVGSLEQRFHFEGPPAEVFEIGQPILGAKLNGAFCNMPAIF
jgi:hypothetical protein